MKQVIFMVSLVGLMFTSQVVDAQSRGYRNDDRREYRQDDGRRDGRGYQANNRGSYRHQRTGMHQRRMKAHRMHHRHMHGAHARPYRSHRGCF